MTLRLIHFMLTLMIPAMLLLFTGCLKAKEEPADYGPEVPAKAINEAFNRATGDASLSTTAVNQFVNYSLVRRLENEESTALLATLKVKVAKREDIGDQARFTLLIEKAQRLSSDNWEFRTSEEPLVLNKSSLVDSTLHSVKPMEVGARDENQDLVVRTSFHRLKESDSTIEPPGAVKGKPGCGGIEPCELPVRFVEFDLVQWFASGRTQKIAFDFTFSTKPPFLPFGEDFDQLTGVLISDCRSTYVPIEGRTVYVRDCFNLENFQK